MKLLIFVVMMAVVLGLGLWQVFSSVQPNMESKMAQHYRTLQEIK